MKKLIKAGSTSVMEEIVLRDSTTGQPKTGVLYSGVTVTQIINRAASATTPSAVNASLGSFTSMGWIEFGSTGTYQFGVPNAAIAGGAGVTGVIFQFAASGCITQKLEYEFTGQAASPTDVSHVGGTSQTAFDLGSAFVPAGGGHTAGINVAKIDAATVTAGASIQFPLILASTTNITQAAGITLADGAITAVKIAAGALNGKGDWNVGKTGYTLAATQTFNNTGTWTGNLVGDVTGNVQGEVQGGIVGEVDAHVTSVALGAIGSNNFASEYFDVIAGAVELHIFDEGDGTQVLQAIVNKINEVDPDLSGLTLSAIAQTTWEYGTRSLTDKSGFALTSAYDAAKTAATQTSVNNLPSAATIAAAVWNAVTSGLTTVGSIGKWIIDNLNATISSRATQTSVDGITTGSGNIVFTGANPVTITVTDNATPTPNVIPGAKVRITLASQSQLQQTNGSGIAQTSTNVLPALDDGTYSYAVTAGMEYEGATGTIVVDATHKTFTIPLVARSIPTPSAGNCIGTLVVVDSNGNGAAGVSVTFEVHGTGSEDGWAYDATPDPDVSDEGGVLSREFPAGSVLYRYKIGKGPWVEFRTAATAGASFTIPSNFGTP